AGVKEERGGRKIYNSTFHSRPDQSLACAQSYSQTNRARIQRCADRKDPARQLDADIQRAAIAPKTSPAGNSNRVSDQRTNHDHPDHRENKYAIGESFKSVHPSPSARAKRPIRKETRDEKQ